ncbi:hypothetical protein BDW75DRAFT_206600 [Aspergillus navahoensis]
MTQKGIAVAGGNGTIGSSIIRALLPYRQYNSVILSRATSSKPAGTSTKTTKTTPEHPAEEITVETRYVDYTSIPSLTESLKDINVLISTLLIPGPEMVPYQLNLLQAAINAGVSRFAPSEFALSQKWHKEVDIDAGKIVVWDAVSQAVNNGKIDAAAFPCGMFMNYLGIGCPEPKQLEALAGFGEMALMFHLDVPEPWVEVPLMEDGRWPDLSMTDIRDVGRFVVAALEIDSWNGRELGMVGETKNLKEIVKDIEAVLGKKVEVRAVERNEYERRLKELREERADGGIMAEIDMQYMMVCGKGGSVVEGILNELRPDVKPIGIRGYLQKYWT